MLTVGVINHGCPKNLVDTEVMLGFIEQAGYKTTLDVEKSDIVLVNTCAFICDAQKESIASIVELIDQEKPVIVAGCLPQKYKEELMKELPEVFAFLGPSDLSKIADVIKDFENKDIKTIYNVSDVPNVFYPENVERVQITVGSSAYIKIADGCNYKCAYCVIPSLRGRYHSRSIDNIYNEAVQLAKKGVSEIILIAQDTSYYGFDKFGAPILASLLEKLNTIKELDWIRIMYAYPSNMTDELIHAIAKLDKVVKYIDLPLQHSHPEILRAMRRPDFDYEVLIGKLRDKIPQVAIRTAFIVGYPGETDEQFEHLYNFVKKMRFDRMGVFEYSKEKNTVSYSMDNHVPKKVKHARYKKLMELQQQISYEVNQSKIDKEIQCIVEGFTDDGVIIMRSYADAPEIDGMVYATSERPVVPGDIETVLIERADEYDLFGKII